MRHWFCSSDHLALCSLMIIFTTGTCPNSYDCSSGANHCQDKQFQSLLPKFAGIWRTSIRRMCCRVLENDKGKILMLRVEKSPLIWTLKFDIFSCNRATNILQQIMKLPSKESSSCLFQFKASGSPRYLVTEMNLGKLGGTQKQFYMDCPNLSASNFSDHPCNSPTQETGRVLGPAVKRLSLNAD